MDVPGKLLGLDVGLARIGVNAYHYTISQLIERYGDGDDFFFRNRGEAVIAGLEAEAKFFVLIEIPMSLCPFCSSDADWPANIVVVYLREAQTFEQANKVIEVSGRFEIGSWTDPETGFVSLVRIVDASFRTV